MDDSLRLRLYYRPAVHGTQSRASLPSEYLSHGSGTSRLRSELSSLYNCDCDDCSRANAEKLPPPASSHLLNLWSLQASLLRIWIFLHSLLCIGCHFTRRLFVHLRSSRLHHDLVYGSLRLPHLQKHKDQPLQYRTRSAINPRSVTTSL